MANNLRVLSVNVNFAPVVDVNINPFNPVINVSSFSDDVATIITLAESIRAGMYKQQIITIYKHFPSHGATSTDSHTAPSHGLTVTATRYSQSILHPTQ